MGLQRVRTSERDPGLPAGPSGPTRARLSPSGPPGCAPPPPPPPRAHSGPSSALTPSPRVGSEDVASSLASAGQTRSHLHCPREASQLPTRAGLAFSKMAAEPALSRPAACSPRRCGFRRREQAREKQKGRQLRASHPANTHYSGKGKRHEAKATGLRRRRRFPDESSHISGPSAGPAPEVTSTAGVARELLFKVDSSPRPNSSLHTLWSRLHYPLPWVSHYPLKALKLLGT